MKGEEAKEEDLTSGKYVEAPDCLPLLDLYLVCHEHGFSGRMPCMQRVLSSCAHTSGSQISCPRGRECGEGRGKRLPLTTSRLLQQNSKLKALVSHQNQVQDRSNAKTGNREFNWGVLPARKCLSNSLVSIVY